MPPPEKRTDREPTNKMVDVGVAVYRLAQEDDEPWPDIKLVATIWRTMHDEALREPRTRIDEKPSKPRRI